MEFYRVTDWDAAYANGAHIVGSAGMPDRWRQEAATFRDALPSERRQIDLRHGAGERTLTDLFLPEGAPRGLVVFVHGGCWMDCDKGMWSHLAAGPLARGHAVAIPGYTLCPEARIAGIGRDVAAAVDLAAGLVPGPIVLTGHSAGGHLATRIVCPDAGLSVRTLSRVRHVLSISGLHDLRPLLHTDMNRVLRMDAAEARAESPALLEPAVPLRLTTWTGSTERAEFLRQGRLLADLWAGLGCETRAVVEPDRHHFDVIDGLRDPSHPLTEALVAPLAD